MKMDRKDWFTVPNLLGYFRILLIPVFAWFYLTAESVRQLYAAAVVIGISGLTDMFDGKIARHFNQITELGKFLDPLADKLTQGAVILCIASRYPLMWILVGLFCIKEGFMGIMGIAMLKHNGRKLDGAKWFGKVCTASVYVVLFLLLLFPVMKEWAADGLILFSAAVMLWALCCYIPVFWKMWREPPKSSRLI